MGLPIEIHDRPKTGPENLVFEAPCVQNPHRFGTPARSEGDAVPLNNSIAAEQTLSVWQAWTLTARTLNTRAYKRFWLFKCFKNLANKNRKIKKEVKIMENILRNYYKLLKSPPSRRGQNKLVFSLRNCYKLLKSLRIFTPPPPPPPPPPHCVISGSTPSCL